MTKNHVRIEESEEWHAILLKHESFGPYFARNKNSQFLT